MENIRYATVEEIKEFQQVPTPDYALLAILVLRAKGPERAMAQFAIDTEIGASTLSRIINMNIKKPLSIDTIIKIFEARAVKEDRGLLESLANANGLVSKYRAERMKARNDMAARRNVSMNRQRLMKNALIAGVVASGIQVTEVVNSPRFRQEDVTPLYPLALGDFVLKVGSKNNLSIIEDWAFYVFPQIVEREEERYARPLKWEVKRILERVSNWFLIDAWTPDQLKGLKMSFAFADSEIFYEFVATLRDANLNNEMTAILVDTATFQVVKEVWIPGNYECLSNISVFEMPAPYQQEDDYIEDGFYTEGDMNDEI